MLSSWTVVLAGLAYVGALFAVATWGDRLAERGTGPRRSLIYALSLGVYCTSWTYFGSVGLASRSGFDFLPIYIGPILVFVFGWRALQRVVDIAKQQNITSIADFIAARYGKSESLGALVALIAVIGIVPYISIQLKAVAFSLETMIAPGALARVPIGADLAFLVAVAMALFAIMFGTRHIDTTEHQHGMMLAIAVESVVKLTAFLAVAVFLTAMAGGLPTIFAEAAADPQIAGLFTQGLDGGRWLTMTLLAMIAILLLPRQFHVTVVENATRTDLRQAAWQFPLYLIAINLFVVPIAVLGLLRLGHGVDPDTYVLALPIAAESPWLALLAFLGGLSASTAMVIVETVALSIMVCNNIVVPILVRRRADRGADRGDMTRTLIHTRRWAIAVILLLSYSYYRMIGSSAALAQIGLISFAAVAQFAPAFVGGLVWRRATARGARVGLVAGFALWTYTLLLPSFADAGWIARDFVETGPLGLSLLRPRVLFNLEFDPLTHGVLWSLGVNIASFVVFSLLRPVTAAERAQAELFVPRDRQPPVPSAFRKGRMPVTVGEVETTLARYLGEERTRRVFPELLQREGHDLDRTADADVQLLRGAEHLLASAIGAASSRLVMGLLLERHSHSRRGAIKLLDEASAAIQYSRDLLQSAIDNVPQAIAVFDRSHSLICWNRRFGLLLPLPDEMVKIGSSLSTIMHEIGASNSPRQETAVSGGAEGILQGSPLRVKLADGRILEVSASPLPDGGSVVTFADISDAVRAAETLQRANETLERRVAERTAELTRLNAELARAKAQADEANLGKTRFIAAASHDILQPLNAARLFTSSLVERHGAGPPGELVHNLDASLEAVEEILEALLDISRLDAGATKPEISNFRIDELLSALAREFSPAAERKGLSFRVVSCFAAIASDRKLLRRILQNLVSNAVKYTDRGGILIGCRRRAGQLRIEVHDTGCGIPKSDYGRIFREFERLGRSHTAPGVGLGLSIVDRIARMLGHELVVRSTVGKGSSFTLTVPLAADESATAAVGSAPVPAGALPAMTVLVVDNEPSITSGMAELLAGWGLRVFTAHTGAEAWNSCEKEMPDIVIADYHLVDETGLDVVRALRRKAGASLPALLITADRSEQVRAEALANDIQCLRKPVRPAVLRAALLRAVWRTEAAE